MGAQGCNSLCAQPSSFFFARCKMAMYTRFVEPGRLALITHGPCAGKMCTVVDIVDQKKVVVDGPKDITGVERHMMPVRRLSLTDFKCKLNRGGREKSLRKALQEGEIMKKWGETAWSRKLTAKAHKANMTDFDRFKLAAARTRRSKAVKKASLKKK